MSVKGLISLDYSPERPSAYNLNGVKRYFEIMDKLPNFLEREVLKSLSGPFSSYKVHGKSQIVLLDNKNFDSDLGKSLRYLLSSQREFLPQVVKCSNLSSYDKIETILKEVHSPNSKIPFSFNGIIFSPRKIIYSD